MARSLVHIETMQSMMPSRIAKPDLIHSIHALNGSFQKAFREQMRVVLYYEAYEIEKGNERWVLSGLLKESISVTLSGYPRLSGRLNEMEGGWPRLSGGSMRWRVDGGSWLGAGGAGAELPYWKDIETEEPNYSTLMYAQLNHISSITLPFLQLTRFECGGFAVGLSCSLLLADPIL
ncbi:taxadien-5-alpha-ol O-acetyltransferase [Amborella trichopoda]|uniref:taxadien-5-alpha-ol O-acetyltransferase n=1 Tax=Amborella trichopoda TaxID=13333 RepID=UPI0009BDFA47|nr:taxadien-5-alpha-ol O-acetyltransferase [Amborella trichopoda]|eukprot:XP_020522545.1 taxadien-5-alpha-ol O-acetyltransferase [Amborella trichopoda]